MRRRFRERGVVVVGVVVVVVNKWNKLPAEVIEFSTVRSFKIQLDKHLSSVL